jgi:hypothetical protein
MVDAQYQRNSLKIAGYANRQRVDLRVIQSLLC